MSLETLHPGRLWGTCATAGICISFSFHNTDQATSWLCTLTPRSLAVYSPGSVPPLKSASLEQLIQVSFDP